MLDQLVSSPRCCDSRLMKHELRFRITTIGPHWRDTSGVLWSVRTKMPTIPTCSRVHFSREWGGEAAQNFKDTGRRPVSRLQARLGLDVFVFVLCFVVINKKPGKVCSPFPVISHTVLRKTTADDSPRFSPGVVFPRFSQFLFGFLVWD